MANEKTIDPKYLEIKVVNVVASVTIDQTLNLIDIMKIFRPPKVEYRPKRFPGLVFRIKKPKTAHLIFSTGKMVCTGAKSTKLARRAVHKVIRELKNKGIIILKKPKIIIQNMVASANFKTNIDLETAIDIFDNIMYEPEIFPGLVYRMNKPKTVLLLFSSGKIVCTGATSEEMVNESVINMYNIIQDNDLLFRHERASLN